MTSLFRAIRANQNAVACPILAANNYVLGSIGNFGPGLAVPALNAIKALRRLYGCPEDGDVDPPPPEFEGGQCVGVQYDVVARGIAASGNELTTNSGVVDGPIEGILRTPNGFGDGTFIGLRAQGQDLVNAFGVTTQPSNAASWRIVDVIRLDGLPDNCGSPEPIYPPPTNFNFNTNITYQIDDGTDVTLNVPFIYAPITANFDGSLRIPFNFNLGGIEFSGDLNLGPELDVTINPPALPPGSGQNTDTLPPGDPADDVPPVPLDEKIIGVAVSSSIVGEQQLTTILTQGMPNILAPRAGSIKFAYSLGISTFWSSDIDVKSDRTFIPCPFSQGADAVVVSPAPGVALSWVPIRGFPLATTRDVQTSTAAP